MSIEKLKAQNETLQGQVDSLEHALHLACLRVSLAEASLRGHEKYLQRLRETADSWIEKAHELGDELDRTRAERDHWREEAQRPCEFCKDDEHAP